MCLVGWVFFGEIDGNTRVFVTLDSFGGSSAFIGFNGFSEFSKFVPLG